jgi:hypothetical protein
MDDDDYDEEVNFLGASKSKKGERRNALREWEMFSLLPETGNHKVTLDPLPNVGTMVNRSNPEPDISLMRAFNNGCGSSFKFRAREKEKCELYRCLHASSSPSLKASLILMRGPPKVGKSEVLWEILLPLSLHIYIYVVSNIYFVTRCK